MMKSKPAMKKPQLDIEDVAMAFATGATQENTAAAEDEDSSKKGAKAMSRKGASTKKKTVLNDDVAAIKLKDIGVDSVTILAEGSMSIYDAAKLKTALMNILQKYQQLEIDLSSVDEMDTAGLQLLLLLKRSAVQSGKNVSLVAHSPASLDVIDRYNLGSYFGDPVIMPSSGA